MPIKHILAPLTGDREAYHVPLCALKLADELKAHVTAASIPLPTASYVLPEAGIAPGAYAGLLSSLENVNAGRSAKARQLFDRAVAETKLAIVDTPVCAHGSTHWVDGTKLADSTIFALSRLVDLVVIDTPDPKGGTSEVEIFEDAIFTARRPVLIVPKGTSQILRKNAAVAWNGSAEAIASVKQALDLLEPGAKITIIQVGEVERGGAAAEELADYLGWHCFEPVIRRVSDKPSGTANIIMTEAKGVGASLLIMGAYTHGRMREMFLGGVTREFLASTDLPLFMAH